jgi:filamentous hemagglutinin
MHEEVIPFHRYFGNIRIFSLPVFGFPAPRALPAPPRPAGLLPAPSNPAIVAPGRVLSRINISNEGWEHVIDRHFPGGTGSQFTIQQGELRSLLGSEQVVGAPVSRTLQSAQKGTLFLREVNVGREIGVDKFTGQPTSTITVVTDRFGNLETTFPGMMR